MSLSNQNTTPSEASNLQDLPRRHPSITPMTGQTTSNYLTLEAHQQSRSIKSNTRSPKSQKASSSNRRSMSTNFANGSSNLTQSQFLEQSQRAMSTNSDDSVDAVRTTKTGRISKARKGRPVHKCNLCDKVSLLIPMPHA